MAHKWFCDNCEKEVRERWYSKTDGYGPWILIETPSKTYHLCSYRCAEIAMRASYVSSEMQDQ